MNQDKLLVGEMDLLAFLYDIVPARDFIAIDSLEQEVLVYEGSLGCFHRLTVLLCQVLEAARFCLVKFTLDVDHSRVDLVEFLSDFRAHRDGGVGYLAFLSRTFFTASDLLKIRLLLLQTFEQLKVLFL